MDADEPLNCSLENPQNTVLSLILCSRNDNYMGNSLWRLQTTLNYVAEKVHELGRENEVEVLVTDWGSEIPLHEVLHLSPAAARITSFILIPPLVAKNLQKDSSFPEVLALNSAVRHSAGEYIGRIDQDTLVGKSFFKIFFEIYEGKKDADYSMDSTLLFSSRRSIPFRFSNVCPDFHDVEKFIDFFGSHLKVWNHLTSWPDVFWTTHVGIWLLHRNLWYESGGYNEQLIYYNHMEIEMILRLKKKFRIVDFGKIVNYDFYHLDHYPTNRDLKSGSAINARKANPTMDIYEEPALINPNGINWGLNCYNLEMIPYSSSDLDQINPIKNFRVRLITFPFLIVSTTARTLIDYIIYAFNFILGSSLGLIFKWVIRARILAATIREQPLSMWPGIITRFLVDRDFYKSQKGRWIERKKAQTDL
jgi:hypothetical protein